MGSLKQNFYNANHAFNFLWDYIKDNGVDFDNTKTIFNCGFYMHHPEENTIDFLIRFEKEIVNKLGDNKIERFKIKYMQDKNDSKTVNKFIIGKRSTNPPSPTCRHCLFFCLIKRNFFY